MDALEYIRLDCGDQEQKFHLVPVHRGEADLVHLEIQVEESGLNVRDLSAYMAFMDRVYGRLVSGELRRYAQLPSEQIEISEIKSGSWEMIFQELMINVDKVSATILLGLVLKYLPDVIHSLSGAYKDIQEARLIQLQREALRRELEKEDELKELKPDEREELAVLLESIYRAENRSLPAAGRFAEGSIKSIRMRVIEKIHR